MKILSELKEKLNAVMAKIKKQNPNANWANLLTGVAVLVMVAVFSYAYFTKSKGGNVIIDDSKLVEQVTKEQPANTVDETTIPSETSIPAEETTVVQKGEGLWHVAQRVCGDGEKYNVLANANGLNVWEDLNEGMTLKVVCK
ncbi:hypothetical protein COT50_03620 [candidate division WWE3 bacterium CG08_land_8_20_14_0_20_41_10]|uniref:LysM domain-containing protein n=1 Tax=candidate division WWE3 bacterium CG08_land_8_20_14_0_20_41_10 TaxID=1975085 RepID=A0A2H0XD92_UNCKA|nr:MAG: hypothetical protein COT50_03620 [candidate division WWE3 bacterium CG08_land_8_20_14_0_20_41_10]